MSQAELELLPCRWRGQKAGNRYPCSSPKLMARRGVTAEHCQKCYCRDHEPTLKFVRTTPPRTPLTVLQTCSHEGPIVDWGTNDICHVRQCLHPDVDWDLCTRGPNNKSVQSCETCVEYTSTGKRHLLYHLMPVTGTGIWQWNLDQLKNRISLFDGRKVIAIVTGDMPGGKLDPPDAVREYLDGCGFEFIEAANNPRLREVVTWPLLWDRLRDLAETDDVVLYAHAKGVTRPWNPGVTVHPWTRLMYATLLDYWPVVSRILGQYPLAGSFLKAGRGFRGSKSGWHYSGSFFWGRLRDLFQDDRLRQIDLAWWGNESWPGRHFSTADAGCVFFDGRVPALDLYSPSYFNDRILPAFRSWTAANVNRRTKWTVPAS